MKFENGKVSEIKIAYVGGGSRNWAHLLMRDLIETEDIAGTVALYDINKKAAEDNAIIGNKYNYTENAKTHWDYIATDTIDEALSGANFVIISILPGTFDEMESDVHTPEKYGIYQSVGDTAGVGGIIRALRTIPMFEVIAKAIEKNCPDAWVINYTNPMTMCVRTLYKTFPKIKAFGCCHEVFGTQKVLMTALKEFAGITVDDRREIKTLVTGVNHFTWITQATYKNIDIFPYYEKFCQKYGDIGYSENIDKNWLNNHFACGQKVKIDLFKRYGVIAAAGDRHLAEFCPNNWYLKNPEQVKEWCFALTPVSYRKQELKNQIKHSEELVRGECELTVGNSGEEGVMQIRALLGLCDLTTNVNLPNFGQIPNLPIGVVVETNASFRANEVSPVFTGNLPSNIYPLIARVVGEQETVVEGAMERNLEKVFGAFANSNQMNLDLPTAKKLFDEMIENTKKYLTDYNI